MPKIIIVKKLFYRFRGQTIPPFGIFIKKGCENDNELIAHEMIHWQQYKRMGLFMFYFRYIFQLIFIGYYTMPMEMEAKQNLSDKEKYSFRLKK